MFYLRPCTPMAAQTILTLEHTCMCAMQCNIYAQERFWGRLYRFGEKCLTVISCIIKLFCFCILHMQVQPPLRRRQVYHKLLVITDTSESLRVTFDACEGSDESHYWDHHAGFTETHITGLLLHATL